MKIYLAARYSSRQQLVDLRAALVARGHAVTSRWLDTAWGPDGEAAPSHCPAPLRGQWAVANVEDVKAADMLVVLGEGERGARGGKHVEFGVAMGLGKRVAILGVRENLFHFHPGVEYYADEAHLLKALAAAPPVQRYHAYQVLAGGSSADVYVSTDAQELLRHLAEDLAAVPTGSLEEVEVGQVEGKDVEDAVNAVRGGDWAPGARGGAKCGADQVAEFARGLLNYVRDGSVVEVREAGFVRELLAAAGLDKLEDLDEGDADGE